jgi:hypothetical protein
MRLYSACRDSNFLTGLNQPYIVNPTNHYSNVQRNWWLRPKHIHYSKPTSNRFLQREFLFQTIQDEQVWQECRLLYRNWNKQLTPVKQIQYCKLPAIWHVYGMVCSHNIICQLCEKNVQTPNLHVILAPFWSVTYLHFNSKLKQCVCFNLCVVFFNDIFFVLHLVTYSH